MEDTKPKTFVIVLMPFDDTFKDVYEVGIKPACKDAGAYCERVDEQIFVENILDRLYNQIAKADVIVAEMSGRNPNVFYEVGYAHALNKQVILLTQDADDIPFDLKPYPHIVYRGSIATLKSELEARVQWCIENPKESLSTVDVEVGLTLNGIALVDKPQMLFDGDALDFNIGIHNPTNRIIDNGSFALALLLPLFSDVRPYNIETVRSVTLQPDGQSVVSLIGPPSMFPGSWESIPVDLTVWDAPPLTVGESLECSLRMFTEVGPKDYPFMLIGE
jgi:hypothetical protein